MLLTYKVGESGLLPEAHLYVLLITAHHVLTACRQRIDSPSRFAAEGLAVMTLEFFCLVELFQKIKFLFIFERS